MNIDFDSIAKENQRLSPSGALVWYYDDVIACMKQATEDYRSLLPNSNAGRKASEETQQLRESIAKHLQANNTTIHTTKELSSKFNATQLEINNALAYLEKRGNAQRVGKKTDHGQGRPLTLWKTR